jgi:hypothetical protein
MPATLESVKSEGGESTWEDANRSECSQQAALLNRARDPVGASEDRNGPARCTAYVLAERTGLGPPTRRRGLGWQHSLLLG